MRHAELKHCRVAMAAFVGWLVATGNQVAVQNGHDGLHFPGYCSAFQVPTTFAATFAATFQMVAAARFLTSMLAASCWVAGMALVTESAPATERGMAGTVAKVRPNSVRRSQ